MLCKLGLIFLAFTVSSIVTYYFTTDGTWINLLFKSLSLSLIIVFLFNYIKLMIDIKRKK
ncbi:hypothetical protein [Staphylococcus edaphicus]|uniref:Uncharacterized protein n=1 Tax=Staphylococcus edaphicus TaxID=1955013 RepID=A0A2C6WI32_9STAP|nr:hypothetical protein [Staphylococcus edaphicus]PHK48770.1 hypothetical protein BTJ66_11665 [Staphylococcus edaphicus]UQW81414.1 hypothetical protein MNY58_12785 [Staphylococcus edaphicus]